MKISYIEQICLPAVDPTFFGKGLAFRAMAVSAGIVGDTGITAFWAYIHVSAKT
jgi:energy-converting hydrogenase Eha subunit H